MSSTQVLGYEKEVLPMVTQHPSNSISEIHIHNRSRALHVYAYNIDLISCLK